MATSSSSRKISRPVPEGYSLHEPVIGRPPKEVLQKRFEKLEELLAKARELSKTGRASACS